MSSPTPLPSTAHIVYCEGRALLDRGPYASWEAVQREYFDYTTSLGPWTAAEIVAFFEEDFGDDDTKWPFRREEIEAFFLSKDKAIESSREGPPIDIDWEA